MVYFDSGILAGALATSLVLLSCHRANHVHCKLQKESRPLLPLDLHHELRRLMASAYPFIGG
jgi:hypothetical protein